MSIQESNALHLLHVLSAIAAVGTIFYACAGAPEARKKTLMWSGIAALLVLLTGIRMWQAMYEFQGTWAVVKIVCWLGLAALTGIAYRKRDHASLWIRLALGLTALALAMVYVQPF